MDDVAQPQLPPPDANGWRPIECAPRDECVLLTGPQGYVHMAFWQSNRGWITGYSFGPMSVFLDLTPTHWMPMPGMPL